ncbi:MAG: hypothetical protein ACRD3I_11675, partial [Terriglobales bacterium]
PPAHAQTRFYFPSGTSYSATVSPGFDSGWNYTSEASRFTMRTTKGATAIAAGTQIGAWTATAGQRALDRQYISAPMAAQTISGTVLMQLMVREFATTDNVDRCIIKVLIVSHDGATVRGTPLAIGNYSTTAEFVSNATHRNKTCADGDTLTSVAASAGDRIVVEIGYENSGSATTPEAAAKWGENATALPIEEAQTTDGAGWIEFSGAITFLDPVGTSGFFDHFPGSSLNARWTAVTAGAGTVTVPTDSSYAQTQTTAANDAAFFYYNTKLDKAKMQLWVLAINPQSGFGQNGIWIVNRSTAPVADTSANWGTQTRIRVDFRSGATNGLAFTYFNGSHTQQYWNTGTPAWGTTAVNVLEPANTDHWYLVGLEIDGPGARWRMHG